MINNININTKILEKISNNKIKVVKINKEGSLDCNTRDSNNTDFKEFKQETNFLEVFEKVYNETMKSKK